MTHNSRDRLPYLADFDALLCECVVPTSQGLCGSQLLISLGPGVFGLVSIGCLEERYDGRRQTASVDDSRAGHSTAN